MQPGKRRKREKEAARSRAHVLILSSVVPKYMLAVAVPWDFGGSPPEFSFPLRAGLDNLGDDFCILTSGNVHTVLRMRPLFLQGGFFYAFAAGFGPFQSLRTGRL
jgi:hypothetical protein